MIFYGVKQEPFIHLGSIS